MIHPGIRTNSSLTGIVSSIAGVVKEAETETALNNEKQTITGTDGVKYTFIGIILQVKRVPAPAVLLLFRTYNSVCKWIL